MARRFIERAVPSLSPGNLSGSAGYPHYAHVRYYYGQIWVICDAWRALFQAFRCAAQINDVRNLVALSLSLSTLYSLNEQLDKALQVLHFGEMILVLFKSRI